MNAILLSLGVCCVIFLAINWLVYSHPLRTPFNPDSFQKKGKSRAPTPQDEIVDLVCVCLQNDRASWNVGLHHLTHEALGFSIWTANGVFGIGLNVDGGRAGPTNTCDERNSFRMDERQRKKLRAAVEGYDEHTTALRAEKIIERVIVHYEKKKAAA